MMTARSDNAAEVGTGAALGSDQKHSQFTAETGVQQEKTFNRSGKHAAVLRVFVRRSERGLNRFEATDEARDFCLPTTVSELWRYFGVGFAKESETFRNRAGGTTTCTRYRLSAEGIDRASELLGADSLEAA